MKKISKILAPAIAIFMMLSGCPKPSAIQPNISQPNMSKFTTLQAVYEMCRNKPFDEGLESLKKFEMINKKSAGVLNMVLLAPIVVKSDEELNKLLKVCPNIETVQIDGRRCFGDNVTDQNLKNWKGLRWTKKTQDYRDYKDVIIHDFICPPFSTARRAASGDQLSLRRYYKKGEVPQNLRFEDLYPLPGIAEEVYPYIVGFDGNFYFYDKNCESIGSVKRFCNLREWRNVRADLPRHQEVVNAVKPLPKLNKLSIIVPFFYAKDNHRVLAPETKKYVEKLREIMTDRENPGTVYTQMDRTSTAKRCFDSKGNEIKRDDCEEIMDKIDEGIN